MSTAKRLKKKDLESDDIKCRLCRCTLDENEEDDFERTLCSSCKIRPEARRLGIALTRPPGKKLKSRPCTKSAREFTVAEKGLIRKVHGYMPAQQLLSILNERLLCDLGPDALPYTMEQLYNQIGDAPNTTASGSHDRASLRRLLTRSRNNGTLDVITEQVINDFAIVFSLNQKQVLVLKDIILQAKEL